MNIIFWFLVVIALVWIWFCLSFAFKGIGEIFLNLFSDAKREIRDDESEKSKNCEDDLLNER